MLILNGSAAQGAQSMAMNTFDTPVQKGHENPNTVISLSFPILLAVGHPVPPTLILSDLCRPQSEAKSPARCVPVHHQSGQ